MSEHNRGCSCGCGHGHEGCGCGHNHHHEGKKGDIIRLCIAALLFFCGIGLSFIEPEIISTVIFVAAYLTAGYKVILNAVKGIVKGDVFGENFLMAVASIGAFAIGEYAESCAVMLLFELGERLQDRAADKSRASIREMLELRPEKIFVSRDGSISEVKSSEVRVGDILVVRAGEKVACDGIIESGMGDIDMASLTGESFPVPKETGDGILAGSISIDATFHIRVTEEYDQSTVAKILETLEHARKNKSRTENFIHRFAKNYTPIVCAFSLAVTLIPPLLGLGNFETWLYRGLCTLAASCPCALIISVPLGFFAGLGSASRSGILVKGGNFLEALAKVNGAAFDKTGTVTKGSFVFAGIENASDENELYFALAVCEKYSTHPLANAAIQRFGHLAGGAEIADTKTVSGRGVRARVGSDEYVCGNAAFMEEEGVAFTLSSGIGTAIYAAKNGVFLGSVLFKDAVKEDSKTAIAKLKELGIGKTVMLTGDKREVAESVANEVGIDSVYSELLPSDKAICFAKVREKTGPLCYVGDGINDAPVLALADVGVAMGGIGSAAALEAADAVILGDSLIKLCDVIEIARKTVATVRLNIIFSLSVKLLIILLATLSFANLWLAVFGDVGVCLIAVLNSLRIMKN
ncbi:MAG: cadmium-translocating P-type ATPase [Clostridia bacterium]|nr:cadmium-translocating P-type ATPase [Clostridia bacterium]